MDLVHLEIFAGTRGRTATVLIALHFGEEFLAKFIAASFDFIFFDAATGVSKQAAGAGDGSKANSPLFFQLVAQFEYLHFDFALAIVLEKSLVWLARLVF